MANTTKFAAFLHRRTNRITRALIYALLEWTLISLLLLNSLLSVFIHKFAKFFGLKPPCIFCSRLDHHFRESQKGESSSSSSSISLDIICEQHAAEISRIGYCSNHRKLVESQSMCLDCSSSSSHDATFFSWMKEIGIVKSDGVDDDDDGKKCTCCDGIIKCSSLDRSTGDLIINQRGQLGSEVDDPKFGYEILGHIDDDDDDDHDGEKEKGEKEVVVGLKPEKEPLLNNDKDEHVEEEKVGINEISVNNKEVVTDRSINLCPDMLPQHLEFYIDHDDYRLIPVDFVDSVKVKKGDILSGQEEDDCKEFDLVFEGNELLNGCVFKESLPSIQEEEDEEKMGISQSHEDEEGNIEEKESSTATVVVEQEEKMEISQIHEEEENKVEESVLLPVLQENKNEVKCFTHLEEQEEKFEVVESHYEERKNDDEKGCPTLEEDEEKMEISQPCEEEHKEEEQKEETMEVSQTHEEDLKNDESILLPTNLKAQKEEIVENSQPHIEEECKNEDRNLATLQEEEEEEKKMEEDLVTSHHFQEESPETDQSAHILEVEEEDTVTEPTEIIASASLDGNQTEVGEPEAVVISERSLNIDVGSSQNELEEEKVPDTPSSVESLHNLHKKLLLLGRRESATEESLDGSMISEHELSTDGGPTIEKLKSELHAERKTLRALYKELEEERSAAAIAANQTMLMINRLQEEKATMQMEALQYQRMLEEQSEYDQEALQMMNELMVKREKEKQELERELDVLRKKVMDYEERERVRVLCRRRSRNSSASCSYGEESDGLSIDLNHEVKEEDHEEDRNNHGASNSPLGRGENGHQDTPTEAVLGLQESLAGFEDERQAILEQLKALEEKLFTLAEEEEEHIDNMKPFDQFYEENGRDFDVNGDHDSNGFSHHHVNGKLNGSMQKRLLPLFDATELMESPDGELEGREEGFDYVDRMNKSPVTKFELEKKRLAIEDEVDVLYERLQALEADREFLKHCIGSLRKGDKGLDLLQEILQHLRDLKNVELQAMKNMDQCASV